MESREQPAGTLELHLRICVPLERQAAFFEFLREAIPFYERPGGIRIDLLHDRHDATRFIERVEYADEETFLADQRRVESDPEMKACLERWRALLAEPAKVEVYRSRVL